MMNATPVTVFTLLTLSAASALAQVPIAWEHTNGPYGGVVYSIVDDGDGRLFAGTEGDGMFMSEDGGETWIETNEGMTHFLVYALAVNQQGQVFAGTDGGGVFRLNTGTMTWSPMNTGLITLSNPLAVVNSIVVNDSGHVFVGLLFRGIYRSTDNGDTWTAVNAGLNNLDVFALALNEDNDVFASTFLGGVFRSTNNGESWVSRNLQNERLYAVLPLPNGEIFAGRFRSTDNGANWAQTAPAGAVTGTFWSFLRKPDGTVYASTNTGVYRFTAPSTWTKVGVGLPDAPTLSMVLKPDGNLFVGTGGRGVYALENGSSFWQHKTTGITNVDVRAIARGNGNDVFAATFWSGIFRSTDNGASWSSTNAGPEILWPVCIMVTPAGTILAGTWYVPDVIGGKIFRSTNNGQTWSQVLQAHNNSDIMTFAVTPNGDIFAGTRSLSDSLYKSTDDGLTWRGVVTTIPTGRTFFSLSVNPSGHIFAGTLADGLVRSEDNGASWVSAQNGLPEEPGELFPQVQAMIFKNNISYAGTYGKGVYSSTTNGNNWGSENIGLPLPVYIRSFAVNQEGDIFAGTESGVYRMVNGFVNWNDVNDGLGNYYVRSVVVTADNHVLAGTWGSGMYRTVGVTTGVQELAGAIPQQYSLEQNYPNPFNPRTNIEFRVANAGLVTLKVFDILGKEVATILSEELRQGSYTIPWDASALPSGVYFYRLHAGSFIDTKKAVLVK